MTAFDLIVRLFGLLLGLAMGEVLSGFVRTLRMKLGVVEAPVGGLRIGWLVPLLGLLIVLSQLSFWLTFYELHGRMPLNLLVLLCIFVVVGGFYLVSGLVFPIQPERWPDFDAYFMKVRRAVVGGLLAIELSATAYLARLEYEGEQIAITTGDMNPVGLVAAFLFLPALVALLVVRGSRASLALLLLANGALLVEAATRFR
jgi:hypothetical protein